MSEKIIVVKNPEKKPIEIIYLRKKKRDENFKEYDEDGNEIQQMFLYHREYYYKNPEYRKRKKEQMRNNHYMKKEFLELCQIKI